MFAKPIITLTLAVLAAIIVALIVKIGVTAIATANDAMACVLQSQTTNCSTK